VAPPSAAQHEPRLRVEDSKWRSYPSAQPTRWRAAHRHGLAAHLHGAGGRGTDDVVGAVKLRGHETVVIGGTAKRSQAVAREPAQSEWHIRIGIPCGSTSRRARLSRARKPRQERCCFAECGVIKGRSGRSTVASRREVSDFGRREVAGGGERRYRSVSRHHPGDPKSFRMAAAPVRTLDAARVGGGTRLVSRTAAVVGESTPGPIRMDARRDRWSPTESRVPRLEELFSMY